VEATLVVLVLGVLLVIFILTTAPPINTMNITLPTAGAPARDTPPKVQYVAINNLGKVSLNGVEMTEDQLLNKLVEFRKADPDLSVVVRADTTLEVQRLVNVLDVLISANVDKFGLSTEPRPAGK